MPDSLPCDPLVQAPIHSVFSTGVIRQHLLSSADFLYQVGAVIWHPQSKRFLLFIKRKGPYNLPAELIEDGCLASAFADPLGFVARETDHKIERLPLRYYVRHYATPFSAEFDDVGLEPFVSEALSTDPFHVTVGRLRDTDRQLHWGELRQVITFWFAGVIVDEKPPVSAPAKPTASTVRVGHLVGKSRTFNDFSDRGFAGFQEYAALDAFFDLWNWTYPDKLV